VDDLRGRWDFTSAFTNSSGMGNSQKPLLVYINALRANAAAPDTFLATGCMRSPETNAFMPLSMKATYNNVNKTYLVVLYSTIIPPSGSGEPYLIRFNGSIAVGGESVKDDQANGTLITQFSGGTWSGLHHDRRETKCPSVQNSGLGFQGDLYVHRDLSVNTPGNWTLYEGYSVIVSSGMQVETPDGLKFVVQEYTDLFSPDVDFIGRFRYLSQNEGLPIIGGTYHFTLLDIFGDPIPGTESTDVWYACNQGAPVNINGTHTAENDLQLSWDAVTSVPGEFEPGNTPQIGFYQIGISPFGWQGQSEYGSAGIASANHVIPWNMFEPGSAGTPDGTDFGMALNQFQDGTYQIGVYAFSHANPQTNGSGHECMTFDSTRTMLLVKNGSELDIQQVGTVSGHVYDAEGNPLGGIGVDTEEGGYGACTDENGAYTLRNVPDGQVNVVAGRDFCGPHPYNELTRFDIQVGASGVNFNLNSNPPLPDITIIAQPEHDWITSFGWTIGNTITMYVDNNIDLADGYNLMLTQTATPTEWDPAMGKVWFDNWSPFDLAPTMYVIVTNGTYTETLLIDTLSVNQFNLDSVIVTGNAPPERNVGVGVHQPGKDFWLEVQSDTNGYWSADFSTLGVDTGNVFDIHAMVWDADGDATQANYIFP
jgi:hypothetical protein